MVRRVLVHILLIVAFFGFGQLFVQPSDQPTTELNKAVKGAGLNASGPSRHFEIIGKELSEWSGRYHLDPSFDAEFSGFTFINIPPTENEFHNPAYPSIDSDTWALESLIIRNDAVTFKTRTRGGESFVFSGSFRLKPRCSVDLDPAGLEGRLVKLKEGVVVAVNNAAFHRVCGC